MCVLLVVLVVVMVVVCVYSAYPFILHTAAAAVAAAAGAKTLTDKPEAAPTANRHQSGSEDLIYATTPDTLMVLDIETGTSSLMLLQLSLWTPLTPIFRHLR